jgi:sarcosine oxidase subunit alpha
VSESPFRTRIGGLVDRQRPLGFVFDGRELTGLAGDTLASALLANGVRLVGRSFKYHRPRGIFGAGAEEPNALVRIGEGERAEPNLKATQIELQHGLVATSQNRWPSLRFDLGSVAGAAAPLLPAGFYYKTFKWPAGAWMLYERLIRRAAGLGRAPLAADPDCYARRFAHCDVLVVGAGPAGLAAARAAAVAGARVALVDEDMRVGGSLLGERAVVDGMTGVEWVGAVERELEANPRVRILRRAVAFGHYDGDLVAVCERVRDHRPARDGFEPRQRLWWFRARQVVLASGAVERPLVFHGNDLPGVMLASAARTYATRYAVRCGERAVIVTNNDSAYEAVRALDRAGVWIRAVVDTRRDGPGEAARAVMSGLRTEWLIGHVVCAARGGRALRSVEIRGYDGPTRRVRGAARRISVDLLCLSGGWSPAVQLHSQARGTLRYDDELAAFVPDQAPPSVHSVGAASGARSLAVCLAGGTATGHEAARAAGARRRAKASVPVAAGAERTEAPVEALWLVPLPGGRRGKRFVDLQNDVAAEDIALAVREGYDSVEHLKRYTTLGMGTDQGRTSNVNGLAILAARTGRAIPEVGTTTFRAPSSPTTVAVIAGPEVGPRCAPVRRSAMHDWHEAARAPFVTAGQWLRPQCYPRAGESIASATAREVGAVRGGVGIVDVSTLGKIELRGRDAGTFLDRIYVNRFSSLRPGRIRYGLMLRDDGFVLDDGTTTRIDEQTWYMTTTTSNAATVLSHLERYAQTVWPDLHVHLTSVTDQWTAMAVAGPSSRQVLAAACSSTDVCDAALPLMGFLQAEIAGVPVRLLRMTFSGERAYEVHVPAGHGLRVWQALLEHGAAQGIVPYGTEAMTVLRIEKGHVVASELDGRTTAADFGFEGLDARRQDEFIGRRSLERPGLDGTLRRETFIGLVSDDDRAIPRGAQLVWNPVAPAPVEMLGHVTSTCYSPTVGRHIALGLLRDAPRWRGGLLHASSPLTGQHVPVRVTDPVFVDPSGARARG